jgi:hypothetical protein
MQLDFWVQIFLVCRENFAKPKVWRQSKKFGRHWLEAHIRTFLIRLCNNSPSVIQPKPINNSTQFLRKASTQTRQKLIKTVASISSSKKLLIRKFVSISHRLLTHFSNFMTLYYFCWNYRSSTTEWQTQWEDQIRKINREYKFIYISQNAARKKDDEPKKIKIRKIISHSIKKNFYRS